MTPGVRGNCLPFGQKGQPRCLPVLRPLALLHWHAQQRHGSSFKPSCKNRCHPAQRGGCRRMAVSASAPAATKPPQKSIFYRQLAEAARIGDYGVAEDCILALTDAGFRMTAHTYHGLVFCYAKAGMAEFAVRYFYQCLEEGHQPLPETYAAVIHSCLENYETAIVEEIYSGLLSASVNRRPGWESYLRGLISMGLRTNYPDWRALFEEGAIELDEDEETQAAYFQDPDDNTPADSSDTRDTEDEDDLEGIEDTADSAADESPQEDVDEDGDATEAEAGVEAEAEATEAQQVEAELDEEVEVDEDGRVIVASADKLIWTFDDLKEVGMAELREEQEPPQEEASKDSGEAGKSGSQASRETKNEAEDEDGEEAEDEEGSIRGADGYSCLLFTDEPLDLNSLDGLEITEGIIGGTDKDLQKPEIAEAIEKIDKAPIAFSIEEVDVQEVTPPETMEEAEAADEVDAEDEPPPELERPAYHPGFPEGKLQLMAKITETMEYGRQEGWFLDLDSYENVLKLLCEDPEQAVLAQDILYADLLDRPEVEAETRHLNCIVSAEAVYKGVRHAKRTVDDMIEGKYGLAIRPDIHSMNNLLEGCVVERMTGKAYAMEDFQEVVASIIMSSMQMNKRTHALQLMMHMLDNDLDKVLWELKEMEGLAAPRMALEELSDHWLSELITFLMERKCVLEVLRLLLVMGDDERDLPDEQETRREDGLSFYTRWLPNFYSSCHLGRNNAGLQKYNANKVLLEHQGVWMDPQTNEVVSPETGLPLAVSKMTVEQVFIELQMRDIPTTGTAEQRASRLQRARNNKPQKILQFTGEEIPEETTKRGRKAQRQADKESIKPYWIETLSVDIVEDKKPSNLYIKTLLEEAKDRSDSMDKSFFENLHSLDLSPEMTGLLKEYRLAVNTKDLERQYMLENRIFDTETTEFLDVNPHFHGRAGFGLKYTWPNFGRGTRLAFYMMEIANNRGGSVTFQDFVQLLDGFIMEKDAEGCYNLIFKLHDLSRKLDPEHLALFYSKALTLCLECGAVEYVSQIGLLMEDLGLQPVGLLDDPEFLPSLRKTAEHASKITEYEKEVGPTLGEALGGAETYRMTDLEGKGEGYPEGISEIYRQPRTLNEVLNRLEILPVEEPGQDLEEEEEGDDESDFVDDEQDYLQGNGAGLAADSEYPEGLGSDEEEDDFDFEEDMGDMEDLE